MVKTHCAKGHEYTPENTRLDKRNVRHCRTCARAKHNRWRRKAGKKAQRADGWLRWKHGLSREEFLAVLFSQGDCCAMCRKPFIDGDPDIAVVDHCHATLTRRGILHKKCNFAIGLLDDDPSLCRLAAQYLESHQKGSNNDE